MRASRSCRGLASSARRGNSCSRACARCPFEIEGELPGEPGWFDPAQLQQVLINLVKNAAEAGSPLAEIAVEVRAVPAGTELIVKDRGAGMTDEVLEKALLPFYTTKRGGTGLGLPLCREIVEGHAGRFSIEQRPTGGTLVRCFIPAAETEAATLRPTQSGAQLTS